MDIIVKTLNVNLQSGPSTLARAFIESLLRKPDAPVGGGNPPEPEAAAPTSSTTPPKIGEYWPGQGGIYAGVARGRDSDCDYHLILATAALKEDVEWQVALDRAKGISADGHSDFSVPSRFESALLYANLQDQLDQSCWHWTSTQYSEGSAWIQHFNDGYQDYYSKSFERRSRFVRRLPL